MKPDGPLTKAGMRRAAKFLSLVVAGATPDFDRQAIHVSTTMFTLDEHDDMMRLARQLYAKAREPKP